MWKRSLTVFVLLLGLTGAILFFPVRLSEDFVCLAEKWFAPSNFTSENVSTPDTHHTRAERRYVFPFGILWWGSMSMLFLGVRSLFKNKESE